MNELKKYFSIVKKILSGDTAGISDDDIVYYLSFKPDIDEAKIKKLVEGGEFASFEDAQAAVVEAARMFQSTPEFKERVLNIFKESEGKRLSDRFTQGANLILGVGDVATSINQISQANK